MRRVAAVTLTVLALALFAAVPVLEALLQPGTAVEEEGALGFLWLSAWLGFPLVGGLLAWRRPHNPLGWILVTITLGLGLAISAETVALYHASVRPLPLGAVATWLTFVGAAPPFALLPFLILLFPTGSLPSPRWRPVATTAALVAGVIVLCLAVRPVSAFGGIELHNPTGVPALGPIVDPAIGVLAVALVAFGVTCVINAVLRFRRSRGVERQQFRWFAYAAAVFPVGMGLSIALQSWVSDWTLDGLVALTFFVSLNGMAVAIGIAVTRYRLYDIDRVVSRTVGYVVLTSALVGVYALGVLGVGALLPDERSDLLVAGSTLAVAALFRPLRSRIQHLVDRRFNRSRYDAARTIEAFGARLRGEIELVGVTHELELAATTALQPSALSVWIVPVGVST